MTKKLDVNRFNKKLQLQKVMLLENIDSVEIKTLVSSAADLYAEIAEFEAEATPAAINALTPHLQNVKDSLQQMLQNPGSYVAVKSEPAAERKVVFKAASQEDD